MSEGTQHSDHGYQIFYMYIIYAELLGGGNFGHPGMIPNEDMSSYNNLFIHI